MDKADEEADQLDLKILTGGSADVSSSVCPLTGLDSLHLQPLDPLTPLAHQLLAAEPTTASSKEKRSSQTSKKQMAALHFSTEDGQTPSEGFWWEHLRSMHNDKRQIDATDAEQRTTRAYY